MKLSVVAGATSQSVNIFIRDSSSTTGAGLTGLVYNTASLTAYYTHGGANATATSITLATLATVTTAYSSGGFKEIDAANMPGWYRFDIPNACLATSKGRSVAIHFKGAANMAPLPIEIELTSWDNQGTMSVNVSSWNSVALSTTNPLPNAAAGASGGLIRNGGNSGAVSLASLSVTGQMDCGNYVVSGTTAYNDTVTYSGTITVNANMSISSSGTISTGPITMAGGSSPGLTITGGSSSLGALQVTPASLADGIRVTTTSGHGINLVVAGASKHGINATGGNSGTSHGALFTAGTGGKGIQADTLNISSNLSVGGTTTLTGAVTASNASNSITGITVASIGTDVITSTALATSAATEIAGAVWDLATTGHTTAGTFGAALSSAGSASDPWDISLPGSYTSGKAGYIVGNMLDAAISSRMATYTQPTGFLAATFPATVASTTNITSATGITVSTNNDKTGYSLSQSFPSNFSSLAITAGGAVTVGTNSDKTGYSLTQSFPSNFSSLSITSAGLVSITSNVKKNQALSSFMFLMTDSTTHAPASGLTVAVTRSIDGGSFSSGTLSSVTEVSAGMYKVDFAAADLNGNVIVLKATASGADTTLERIVTQP